MVLAALSALVLGTTPEATIKEFVAAFNANNFDAVRRLLVEPGNKLSDSFLKDFRVKLQLQRCSVKSNSGSKAVLICSVIAAPEWGGPEQKMGGDDEEVNLTKIGSEWKIQYVNDGLGSNGKKLLNQLAFVLSPRGKEMFEKSRRSVQWTSALVNVKKLAVGFTMYLEEHNDVFPSIKNWKKALLPYVDKEEVFSAPPDKKGTRSWTYNKNVAGKSATQIKDASQTVLLYLSKNGQPDFRYDGKTIVAFCDTGAKAMTKAEFAKLKLK
ncbi:MAG: hypothetical protein JST35_07255 [Armatimonadetes bacterium]|nr:hypothetical protein [Armatimonadota bacterium]